MSDQTEQCPVCGTPIDFEYENDGRLWTSYIDGAIENAAGELIRLPDELILHMECDAKLQKGMDAATDYEDLIARARAL